MTDEDLDRSYGDLCRALSDVGQDQAALLLAMVCLSLISRSDDAGQVRALIDRARARCLEPGDSSAA